MPFGEHKDKPMKDVPAKYLLWLYDEIIIREEAGDILRYTEREVADYIEENLEALEEE